MRSESTADRSHIGSWLTNLGLIAASGALLAVMTVLFGSSDHRSSRLAVALLVVVVGAAVVLLHPNWIYRSLAFILGAIPMATVPGLGTPVILVLAFAVWCAVLTHPIAETRTSRMEFSVGVLVVVSAASLVITAATTRDVTEFAKWLLATSMVSALLRLSRRDLFTFGRVFVWGAFVGASTSLVMRFVDTSGIIVGKLSVIGVTDIGYTGAFSRLTGTYVEPNSAGIFLLIALTLGGALLRGWQRLVVTPVILLALVFTLSRSAMLSILIAVIFIVVFRPMPTRTRTAIVSVLAVGSAAAMSVPMIRHRFTDTFSDRGSLDRLASLGDYTRTMAGSWWFGKGWGRPEFIDADAGFRGNHVANSPLLSVYRGGLLTGLAFVVVLVVGCVVAYRNVDKQPWEASVIGASFVGFTVVALQLDFPVVTHAPVTMVWSVFIVFLISNTIEAEPPDKLAIDRLDDRHKDATRV